MLSDEQLMLQFRDGSLPAFGELFNRYRKPMYGYFRRRLPDAARAEELAQETFLVILRGAERYEVRARFRTYLYAVALKLLWSERRKDRRDEARRSTGQELHHDSDPVIAMWIREALCHLDPGHREALMLREYEQLSYDEIADLLRIPVNTVRSRLFRARQELKALLNNKSQPVEEVLP